MGKRIVLLAVLLVLVASNAVCLEVYRKDDVSLNAGWWGQVWGQSVSDMDTDGDGEFDDSLNDILVRRSYFYLSGNVTPELSFFMHYAGDKLGMDEGPDDSGKGLGTGLALRDAWVSYKVLGNDLIVQAGRMYIPFTRNYGTTSTKSLLTTDLNWGQGGHRSTIFYPSNVGRDDALTLWGNVLNDKLQYRFMVGDGEEGHSDDDSKTPENDDDTLRYAGRVSYSVFEPETKWFNAGTYRGTKQVLAFGLGMDSQNDLILNGEEEDYFAWTADVFYEQPLAGGDALTLTGSYIDVSNSVNGITFTQMASGDDASIMALKAGYYLGTKIGPGNLQPFGHYQLISSDETGRDDTQVYGVGMNYYLKGAANKITLEGTFVDQDEEVKGSADVKAVPDETLVTLQLAVGF
ncbi:MAG: OprO/OprP family phosphate-selective porin [Geobacteraceae bacterium]|nr:OprO/OprP family phosphate-selective porin [Geobacteraceae bacterium]